MKLLRSTTILLMVVLAFSLSACSGGQSPVDPSTQDIASFGIANEGRNIIAAYEVTIDPIAETVTMEPVSRENAFHFKLGTYNLGGQGGYPVLSMTGYGFGPFWADFTLTHPFPGSGIKGYDAKVIALLPANAGVSFNYPSLGVQGNNAVVLEPDGYTPLHDSALTLPGNVNPFRAYFKSQPFRVWSGTGTYSETQTWDMSLPGFGGPIQFLMVCDVSTNFPAAPQPVTDNAPEPVDMTVVVATGLTPAGGSANIDVTILDWQGYTGNKVEIEVPSLFSGKAITAYFQPGGPDLYTFRGTISNSNLAPIGDYVGIACAEDIGTGLAMYKEFTATVSEGGGPGNWTLDPARGNVDMSGFALAPAPGSDIGVSDAGIPDYDGVIFYSADNFITRADLALTDADYFGSGFYPWDDDPLNPHPAPDDAMQYNRLDTATNGAVFATFDDEHQGLGDNNGNFQHNDVICIMFMSDGVELSVVAAIYIAPTDDPDTTEYDEGEERPRVTDVWDEAPANMLFVQGIFWRGTVLVDPDDLYFNHCWVGGYAQPYYDGTAFVDDWGLWRVSNPPFGDVIANDASQEEDIYMFQYLYCAYWFAAVVRYDKDFSTVDVYYTADDTADVLDVEVIPLQNPPLEIDDYVQLNEWVAVLNDNGTVEIYDPAVTGGQLVEMLDITELTGDAYHMDIADASAEIWITHTDGTTPYCSVYLP